MNLSTILLAGLSLAAAGTLSAAGMNNTRLVDPVWRDTAHVVSVSDHGALPDDDKPDTAAIRRALEAAQAWANSNEGLCEVRFSPGKYLLDAPEEDGKNWRLFRLVSAKRLRIDGHGAQLTVKHPRFGLFYITDSEDLVLHDFVVDYDPLPFSAGKIRAIHPDLNAIDIEIAAGHPSLAAPYFSEKKGYGYPLDPVVDGRLRDASYNVYFSERIETLENGLFRIVMRAPTNAGELRNLRVGGRFAQLSRQGGSDLFFASHSSDIVFSSLTSYAAPAGHYVGANVKRLAILDCRALIAPGRWKGGNADGVHAQGCTEGPRIENSRFEGLGDDGVNIYSRPLRVSSLVNDREVAFYTAYPGEINPGDELQFFDPVAGEIVSSRNVVSYDAKTRRVVLDGKLGRIRTGRDKESIHVYKNLKNQGFVIKNSEFLNLRRFGNIIKGGGGVLEGNVYKGTSGSAIILKNEPGWPEGLYSENVVIRNNVISECGFDTDYFSNGYAALTVRGARLGGPVTRADFHKNLRISGNRFDDWNRGAILLRHTTDATIVDNQIGAARSAEGVAIVVNLTADVKVSGNSFSAQVPTERRIKDGGENRALSFSR